MTSLKRKLILWPFVAFVLACLFLNLSLHLDLDDVQKVYVVEDRLYGVYEDKGNLYGFHSLVDGSDTQTTFLTSQLGEDTFTQLEDFRFTMGQWQAVLQTNQLDGSGLYTIESLYFTMGEELSADSIAQEYPLVYGENGGLSIEGVSSLKLSLESLFEAFLPLWLFFLSLSFLVYIVYHMILRYCLTLSTIAIFLLASMLLAVFFTEHQVDSIYKESIENYEKMQLLLLCAYYDETSYDSLLKDADASYPVRDIYTQEGDILTTSQDVIGIDNDIILVSDEGYLIYGSDETSFSPEEMGAMDYALEENTIYSITHGELYHEDSFTVYVPLQNSQGDFDALYRATYFYDMYQSSDVSESIGNRLQYVLLFIIVVTLILVAFFLLPVIAMNSAIAKTGKYHSKKTGLSEIRKLGEILTELSQLSQRELSQISKLKESYEEYLPKDMVALFPENEGMALSPGDKIQVERPVLLLETKDFLQKQEDLPHHESFAFLSHMMGAIEPLVGSHGGFISQSGGGSFMAMFREDTSASTLLDCGNAIARSIAKERIQLGGEDVSYGIFLDHASLEIGVVGGEKRKEFLQLSPQLEKAKNILHWATAYQTGLLMGASLQEKLILEKSQMENRYVGRIDDTAIYEVFISQSEEQQRLKRQSLKLFHEGLVLEETGSLEKARDCFIAVLKQNREDRLAFYHFSLCNDKLQTMAEESPALTATY